MSSFETQLQFGTPHANRVQLMGRIQAAPSVQSSGHGNAMVVLLHISPPPDKRLPESLAARVQTSQYYSNPVDTCHEDTPVSILVRGPAAQWCAAGLRVGMVLHVEAYLRSLGTTASGACLAFLEAEQIQVINHPSLPDMPVFASTPPPPDAWNCRCMPSTSTN